MNLTEAESNLHFRAEKLETLTNNLRWHQLLGPNPKMHLYVKTLDETTSLSLAVNDFLA